MSKINLNTFAGGALAEQLNIELQKVIDNIDDPNTPPVAVRKLTLEISLKPNQRRNGANVTINVKSKLAPVIPVETAIMIGRDGAGNVEAAEIRNQVAGQLEMDLTEIDTPTGKPGVINLRDKKINEEVAK